MSDLHLEHKNRNQVDDFFQDLSARVAGDGPELLIIAGDITSMSKAYMPRAIRHFTLFTDLYKDVIYLPGNHEYYDSSFAHVVPELVKLEIKFPNLHILDHNSEYDHKGVKFIGDTMWYPRTDDWRIRRGITDHALIKDLDPTVYDNNALFVSKVVPSITKDCVVITHHMPFEQSIQPRFKGDVYNHFFMFDCEKFVTVDNAPRLWIHGHTHDACDYTLPIGTRVFCNPMGYPHEGANPDFWNNILVKI
jgi:predicted phosphohydrolase